MILNKSYKVPTIFGGAFTDWIAIILLLQKVQAGRIACTETSTCTAAYNTQGLPGLSSICMSDGYCSNPYDQGCLRAHLGPENFPTKRICNSDDPEDAAERGLCEVSSFEYDEIRIENQDWDRYVMYYVFGDRCFLQYCILYIGYLICTLSNNVPLSLGVYPCLI